MSGIRQFEQFCIDDHTVGGEMALRMLEKFFKTVKPNRPRRPSTSKKVTEEMAALIRTMDGLGYAQHTIAEMVGTNQGRVNEVLKGRTHE